MLEYVPLENICRESHTKRGESQLKISLTFCLISSRYRKWILRYSDFRNALQLNRNNTEREQFFPKLFKSAILFAWFGIITYVALITLESVNYRWVEIVNYTFS